MNYEYENNFGIPEILTKALVNRERRSYVPHAFASASQLSGPAYSWALWRLLSERDHTITIDMSDLWSRVQGKALHSILEDSLEGRERIVQRETFVANYGHAGETFIISGEPDVLDESTARLYDMKNTTIGKRLDEESIRSWVEQINIYASLLRINGKRVDSAAILVGFKDWSKMRRSGSNYPQAPLMELEIPVWSPDEADKWIVARCRLFKETWEKISYGTAEPCSPEERWESVTKYAVQKEGNVKPSRVLDSQEEAQAYIDAQKNKFAYSIEVRPGERKRCAHFCDVADHCSDWTRAKKENNGKNQENSDLVE